jgi:hypothetical protein
LHVLDYDVIYFGFRSLVNTVSCNDVVHFNRIFELPLKNINDECKAILEILKISRVILENICNQLVDRGRIRLPINCSDIE